MIKITGEALELDWSRCRDVRVVDAEGNVSWSRPFEHVKTGVQWIMEHPWALLADDMGGMKTAQTIIAAQFMHDAGVIDRVIVVAPAPVRAKVWFDRDLGQLAEQVFEDKRNVVSEWHAKVRKWEHGPKDAPPLKWITTNYEFIRSENNLLPLFQYCGPKTLLVCDESSAVRGRNSAQTDAVMRLRWLTNRNGNPILGQPRCGRVLQLNGTPLAESPMDLFTEGNLLHPSILDCRYVTHFKARYAIQEPVLERGKPMVRYGKVVQEVAGWSNLEDLTRRFAPYVLRREKAQFGTDWSTPPVCLEVALTPTTWNHYKDMRDQMVAWLESGVASARTAAVKSLRLSQITSGFLGGVEAEPEWDFDEADVVTLPDGYSSGGDLLGTTTLRRINPPVAPVQEIGREKLDFSLEFQEGLLRRHPDLKLLEWFRFVPELRRQLRETEAKFGHPVEAACGEKVFTWREGSSQKKEREAALRLLHPKTAPPGAATVGATSGTGALGLNFTACRTVLDVSYDFSSFKKKQGDSRVDRTGQVAPVSFYYLVAVGPRGQKTIDHHVMSERLGKTRINDLTTAAWVRMLREE